MATAPALLRTLRGYGLGLLGAALAPALLFWVLGTVLAFDARRGLGAAVTEAAIFAIAAAIVAGAHALGLGLPGFLLLRKFRKASAVTTSLCGFLVGLVPFAVYAFPRPRPGWSSGAWMWGDLRRFYVDGVPTVWEWISYAQSGAMMGLFGLCGALVFWLQWRRFGAQPSSSG